MPICVCMYIYIQIYMHIYIYILGLTRSRIGRRNGRPKRRRCAAPKNTTLVNRIRTVRMIVVIYTCMYVWREGARAMRIYVYIYIYIYIYIHV